jgi:hypothetical protein
MRRRRFRPRVYFFSNRGATICVSIIHFRLGGRLVPAESRRDLLAPGNKSFAKSRLAQNSAHRYHCALRGLGTHPRLPSAARQPPAPTWPPRNPLRRSFFPEKRMIHAFPPEAAHERNRDPHGFGPRKTTSNRRSCERKKRLTEGFQLDALLKSPIRSYRHLVFTLCQSARETTIEPSLGGPPNSRNGG